jgi:hypothetical protein
VGYARGLHREGERDGEELKGSVRLSGITEQGDERTRLKQPQGSEVELSLEQRPAN